MVPVHICLDLDLPAGGTCVGRMDYSTAFKTTLPIASFKAELTLCINQRTTWCCLSQLSSHRHVTGAPAAVQDRSDSPTVAQLMIIESSFM